MKQLDFFIPKQLRYLDKIGEGATNSNIFEDENDNRYIGKSSISNHKFLIANEIISYKLALLLGLKVSTSFLKEVRGEKLFFSLWLEGLKIIDIGFHDLEKKLNNWQDLLHIFCFDIWILNADRHLNNLIFTDQTFKYDVYIIDHDQALFGKSTDESVLLYKHSLPSQMLLNSRFLPLIKNSIFNFTQFSDSIEKIHSLNENELRSVIFDLENDLLAINFKNVLFDILKTRKDNFEKLIVNLFRINVFPNTLIIP